MRSYRQDMGVEKKPRHLQSARDMVFSLSAVLIPVVVILALTWRSHDQFVPEIDYAGAITQAVASSPFPIEVPSEIPAGYSVSAAAFEAETYGKTGDVRWRISFISGERQFISLWQTTGSQSAVLDVATNSGVCDATQEIAGKSWTVCDQGNPESRAYFTQENGVTTVVYGTVTFDELVTFIESLSPRIS